MRGLLILVCLITALPLQAQNFAERQEVQSFCEELSKEDPKLSASYTLGLFKGLASLPTVIQHMDRPYEALSWDRYRAMFLTKAKIDGGVRFWQEHAKELAEAERNYGVNPELIVSIIGIESGYGKNPGKYPVLQSLATLAFDYPRRAAFFRTELKEFLKLCLEHNFDPLAIKGSYAGAMGIPQFIASSYRQFGVDFDKSGPVDLMHNVVQVIGSVANFFQKHGWQPGMPVVLEASANSTAHQELENYGDNNPLPTLSLQKLAKHGVTTKQAINKGNTNNYSLLSFKERDQTRHYLGTKNFYVLTRYNRSSNYAMAVYLLSTELAKSYYQHAKNNNNSNTRTKS